MIIQPTVSICCITYNHENFIGQAIESFLMQKTSFPIEILIHDDASTDKTADIIREYELKYPDIIKPIYQTENQYSKGVSISATFQYPRALGKYIALCEGDDYWTDPLKLQKQVDFLEENPDFSMCYHSVIYSIKSNISQFSLPKNKVFYFKNSLLKKQGATLSLVFVKKYLTIDFNKLVKGLEIGDWPLEIYLLTKGKGYYFCDEMGFYRKHNSSATSDKKFYLKSINTKVEMTKRLFTYVDFIHKFQVLFINIIYRLKKLKYKMFL